MNTKIERCKAALMEAMEAMKAIEGVVNEHIDRLSFLKVDIC